MKQAVQLLAAARDLIEHVGWTKKTYARDANRREVDTDNPTACAFCARGALIATRHAFPGIGQRPRDDANIALAQAMFDLYPHRGFHVTEINDHRDTTKADVLAAFDLAIKELT